MGYCTPGAFARWTPPPRVEAPDPYAEARRACKGVFADIVGRGRICIDPGDLAARSFRDCKDGFCGPEMVALPRGRYLRGVTDAELAALKRDFPGFADVGKEEQPTREVAIGTDIAIAKFELTFQAWEACRRDARCMRTPFPRDEGWGRGRHPVIHLSWDDVVREYLPWLNAKLGLNGEHAYRLPTDAEWEFAARAGTTTRYASGDRITAADARFRDGSNDAARDRTAEVGSFPANAFGLHDMHGNVQEWVQDCFGFLSAASELPVDGTALEREGCRERALRGGAFTSHATGIRSASRTWSNADRRSANIGVRVARTLSR
jgi:formylglycine-generating enzyme required for sulfatase activity